MLRGLIVADVLQNALAAARVESRRRLVQNQHIRLHCDHARDGRAALLPAGQVERRFLQLGVRNADELRRPFDACADLFLGQAHVFRAE